MEDIEISLGGDSDCEYCGYSNNRVELQFDERDQWNLAFLTGCTGGEAASKFDDAYRLLDWYEKNYPVYLDQIREALEELETNG